MHDAGARQLREPRFAVQQRVLQRGARIAGSRVHDQTGRLVDDDQRLVLVHHVERDWFSGERDARFLERVERDSLAAGDEVARTRFAAVHPHPAGVDPVLEPGARVLRKQRRQRLVEALATVLLRDQCLERAGHPGNIRYTPAPCIFRGPL